MTTTQWPSGVASENWTLRTIVLRRTQDAERLQWHERNPETDDPLGRHEGPIGAVRSFADESGPEAIHASGHARVLGAGVESCKSRSSVEPTRTD
jgi:hypothetical protein